MGMFGARFAVFVRRARVLPSPCHATSFFGMLQENESQLLSNKTHMPKNLYQMSSENTDAAFAVELESPKGGGLL
jgi:hypothetical protein